MLRGQIRMKADIVIQVPQINMRAPLKPTRRGPPGAPGNSENETGGCIDFVGSNQCCGSGMFIQDPESILFHPGFRSPDSDLTRFGSASKNLSIFNS